MSLRETRSTTKEDNATSNHIIFAEHHHGPSPGEHRRQPDEDGPNRSSSGCTPTGPVWPETWSVDANRLAQRRYGGVAQVQCTWRQVWYLPYEDEAFSKFPLPSTYKRRLPPHLNTQRNKSYTTRAPF
jgi:hypothetical protein